MASDKPITEIYGRISAALAIGLWKEDMTSADLSEACHVDEDLICDILTRKAHDKDVTLKVIAALEAGLERDILAIGGNRHFPKEEQEQE